MPLECVLDAEIFKRYCSDKNYCSADELMQSCLNQGISNILFYKECYCLINFLGAIKAEKCIICYNNTIITEYEQYIDKLPQDLLDYISSILSDTRYSRKENGSLIHSESFSIKSTGLKSKVMYLDVAKSLTNKRIVATKEDAKDVYNQNVKILLRFQISCKDVCGQWDEIRQT